MSRREFRVAIDAPRPAAAWVMVGVAGTTLWITQQLEAWAIGLQALALLGSLALRTRPHAWQRSPIALNVGMFGIVTGTISVALRGAPATISLAHFAALTQGLQLFDARPRRTEFLLVALALFQVILAANLTDSVFFFPLLAAFVVSTTWTLVVHTLRTEAAEAGIPSAVTRTLTPGLLRTTLLASCLSLALALLFFLALPRMRANVIRAPSLGAGLASAGFSDSVSLGDLGRIRQDRTVVMRVETLEGETPEPEDAYWRGLAFDAFDGRNWSITPPTKKVVPGSAEVGISLGSHGEPPDLVQRVVREGVSSGVLFSAGVPQSLQGYVPRLLRDLNGGLYAPKHADERLRYTVATLAGRPGDGVLARDEARPPRQRGERYLQLPELDGAIARLAGEITEGSPNDAARARALESYLRRTGRYDDRPPHLPPEDPRSPVEIFLLGETTGHCEYFASSMIVMARSLGLPARLVNGFAGGRENTVGGFVELTRSDAHAWVEIHFAEAGWVRYDPTPPDLRLRAASGISFLERLAEVGSAVELWWFQRVVDFDRSDQFSAIKSVWLAWRRARGWGQQPSSRLVDWRFDRDLAGDAVIVVPGGVLLLILALRVLRARRRGPSLHEAYAQALRLLARRGIERAPACTARDFARQVRAALPGPVSRAFEGLTEFYLRERFGGRISGSGVFEELNALRSALRDQPARKPLESQRWHRAWRMARGWVAGARPARSSTGSEPPSTPSARAGS